MDNSKSKRSDLLFPLISFLLFFSISAYLIIKGSFSLIFSSNSIYSIVLLIWFILSILLLIIWILKKFIKISFLNIFSSIVLIGSFSIYILITLVLFIFLTFNTPFKSYINNNETGLTTSDVLYPGVPNLEITVISSPNVINSYCDVTELRMKVKNNGDIALTYNDLLDGKYEFRVCYGFNYSTCDPIWMKIGVDSVHGGLGDTTIEDFGSILPNKEKVLTVVSGSYDKFPESDYETYVTNMFARTGMTEEDGEYSYRIQFLVNGSTTYQIANSNEFSISSEISNAEGIKECSH